MLWKLAIEFEALSGQTQAAKQLCYRALAAVGGVKGMWLSHRPCLTLSDLYLLPFDPILRPAFTEVELQQIHEQMMGRGIRIRIPAAAYWNPVYTGRDVEDELPHDDEPAEDDLQFMRDRQALRPY